MSLGRCNLAALVRASLEVFVTVCEAVLLSAMLEIEVLKLVKSVEKRMDFYFAEWRQ